MTTRTIEAIECTCEVCGATWKSFEVPGRCSGCKSRKWNLKGGDASGTKHTQTIREVAGVTPSREKVTRVKEVVEDPVESLRGGLPDKKCGYCMKPVQADKRQPDKYWKCDYCRRQLESYEVR